jgi:hypothetical protein
MDPGELLFLLDRAHAELANADSEEAWRFKLADLVERIGELIERAAPPGTTAPTQEPIIGKLAAAICAGYHAPPNRALERAKQKLDFLLIMGGDYAEDSLVTAKVGPGVSSAKLERLLHDRMTWLRCRTRPEAVQRLMDCLTLSRATAEHRVNKVCKTFDLRLEPGRKFSRANKGGSSLA